MSEARGQGNHRTTNGPRPWPLASDLWPLMGAANRLCYGDLHHDFLRSQPARRLDAGLERFARTLGRRWFGPDRRARPASVARPRSLGRSHVFPYIVEVDDRLRTAVRAASRTSAGIDVDDHTDRSDAHLPCCRSTDNREPARKTLFRVPLQPSRVAGGRHRDGRR